MFLTEFLSSPQLAQMIGATAAAKILWTGVGGKKALGGNNGGDRDHISSRIFC